jgi:CBS domain containing-hemolysin-like protein
MQTFIIILFCLAVVFLVLVAGISPRRTHLSRFELERRREEGDTSAHGELERELAIADVVSFLRAIVALLLVMSVLLAVAAFGPFFGTIAGVVIALVYGRLSRIDWIHGLADRMYQPYDESLVKFVQGQQWIGRFIRSISSDAINLTVGSREELEHLISESGRLLTPDEKKLLANGLHFSSKTVESIMTPRGVIASVQKTDLVGPLLLDELHRTGYSRFPVIDGDIDHVIGVLHIRELLALKDKSSETAEQAMEKKVYYIHQDQTLDAALAAFLKTRHHLFVVVNGYRETAGLLSLEDVIEALLGRQIIDEFDLHDNLRAVAEREAKHNNRSPHGVDV